MKETIETKKLTQWAVKVGEKYMAMFTPLASDPEDAMAIAVATFGENVSELESEGAIRQGLTARHLHIVDTDNCSECGEHKNHSDECSQAVAA